MGSKPKKGRALHAAPIPRTPPWRLFVLAILSVALSVWAVVRYYTHPRPPMLVPAPESTEIPAPSVIPSN